MSPKRIDMSRIRATTRNIGRELRDDGEGGQGDLHFIEIDKLDPNPSNPRRLSLTIEQIRQTAAVLWRNHKDPDEFFVAAYELAEKSTQFTNKQKADFLGIVELAHSIHQNGLVQPVVVKMKDGGRYEVIVGHRRLFAHHLLRRSVIRSILRPGDDSYQERILALTENLDREDLTFPETIDAIREIALLWEEANPGKKLTGERLSRIIHRTPRQCRKYLKILAGPDNLMESIKTGEVTTLSDALDTLGGKTAASDPANGKRPAAKRSPRVARPGKPRTRISLGATPNPAVIRTLILKVLGEARFEEIYPEVDWSDLDQAQRAWNEFLTNLEKTVS